MEPTDQTPTADELIDVNQAGDGEVKAIDSDGTVDSSLPEEDGGKTQETLDEEKAAAEAEAARLENNRRSEAGKIAALERKAYLQDQAIEINGRLSHMDTAIDAIAQLATSQKQYNDLQPYLAKANPVFKDLDWNGFRQQVETLEPSQKEVVKQVEAKTNYEENLSVEVAKARLEQKLAYEIPDFKKELAENPAKANKLFNRALEDAAEEANRLAELGELKDKDHFEELIKEALLDFNPRFKNNEVKKELQQMINGASATTPATKRASMSEEVQALVEEIFNDPVYKKRIPDDVERRKHAERLFT